VTPLLPKKRPDWEEGVEPPPMPDRQDEPGETAPPDAMPAKLAVEEAPLAGPVESPPTEPGEPAPVPDPSEVDVPRALAQEIRRAMKRYPQTRSASIPALWAVQRRYGWCSPEGIHQAAAVMGVTPGYLESVATFYDLFRTEPQGAHQVLVCTNISCWLRGGDELLAEFCRAADTEPGETSADGKVFVRGFECLGACDIAPMASIDERYYGPLEDGEAVAAIEQLRAGEDVLPEKRLEDRAIAGEERAQADQRLTKHPVNKVKGKVG
jgi:NADH:ubiquinone oxidoreductase subunit E